MRITIASIGGRLVSKSRKTEGLDAQVRVYLERCAAFAACGEEAFASEGALLAWLDRQPGRTPVFAVLLDSRGRSMSSEAFAAWLGARRDEGTQHLAFCVGPADGWSAAARERAGLLLSLGPMTLAHALARVVVAEQVYRAFTILSGHPYHCGH